ncbi:MAG: hypothetical protein ACKVX7_01845 [Planctomycetota bacterium]
MVGARESDNPHVPFGSKLKDAEFPEPRDDDAYQQELHDRTLALYGERGTLKWVDNTVNTQAAKPAARAVMPLKPAMESSWHSTGLIAAVIAALALGVELVRRVTSRDRMVQRVD